MFEIPKSYKTTIAESFVDGRIRFYKELLQVTIGNFGVIYDISDITNMVETQYIDTLDQFVCPGHYVHTGFNLATSHIEIDDE